MAGGKTLIAPGRMRERSGVGDRRARATEEVRPENRDRREANRRKRRRGKEEMSPRWYEVWGIRGWSLKVREEPLSTGSSQNESCYLILLSTLLRFIRQLLDALQYAANRARIVRRRRSRSPWLYSIPFPCFSLLRWVSYPSWHGAHKLVQSFRVPLCQILSHYRLHPQMFSTCKLLIGMLAVISLANKIRPIIRDSYLRIYFTVARTLCELEVIS